MASLLSRPQVGIERLPVVRRASTEHRESMNCKSCRKRKIKCNRLRPMCEACTVFQCACVYDAIPKKRGPKTDVLEALLKRVDGLEKKLQDKKEAESPAVETTSGPAPEATSPGNPEPRTLLVQSPLKPQPVTFPPTVPSYTSEECSGALIDTFFLRVHDRPFHVLDEFTTREMYKNHRLPPCLRMAICSLAVRFMNHGGDYSTAVRLSEDYATEAREAMDVDEPSIEGLQTLLLVRIAFFAAGKGKKSYMLLATAIGMALALDLHRETSSVNIIPAERELRRHLFWTCYLMDRLTACGSKRPSLISDKSMLLRVPSSSRRSSTVAIEGDYFASDTDPHYAAGAGRPMQGSWGMLIDIARILGVTDCYLAKGGVKGDSHFPWHGSSILSKIRHDLDLWASSNEDIFTDDTNLVSQTDSCRLVLSKMTYHLIHCLIYRPFLPLNLAELRGTGQHQSWQIEATHLCFLHANAIAELAEAGRLSSTMGLLSFMGYSLCTAGTVHVHGAHYQGLEGEVYSSSARYLSQEMQMLSEIRYTWANAQHQRNLLQSVYVCHSKLIKSMASNPLRISQVFHLEDFYDRYPGQNFDAAHVTFTDMVVDGTDEIWAAKKRDTQNLYSPLLGNGTTFTQTQTPGLGLPTPPTPYADDHHGSHTEFPRPSSTATGVHSKYEMQPLSSSTVTSQPTNFTEYIPPYNDSLQSPMTGNFSRSLTFSPLQQGQFDPMLGMPSGSPTPSHLYNYDLTRSQQTVMTPGGRSQSGSINTSETEKDPFLMLLEQLAENEYSRGGPSDLDFYLGRQEG